MQTGELAKAAGISPDTIRHYERKGVLKNSQRLFNGYRAFPPEALQRVFLVRRALAVGFTLDELARLLRERDKGSAPCREVREMAAQKLSDIEIRLSELLAMRDDLTKILDDWNQRLTKTPTGEKARLLESLNDFDASSERAQTTSAFDWKRRKKAK